MRDVEVGSVGGSTRPAMRLSRSKLSKISHQGVLEEGRLGAQGQGYSFSKTEHEAARLLSSPKSHHEEGHILEGSRTALQGQHTQRTPTWPQPWGKWGPKDSARHSS